MFGLDGRHDARPAQSGHVGRVAITLRGHEHFHRRDGGVVTQDSGQGVGKDRFPVGAGTVEKEERMLGGHARQAVARHALQVLHEQRQAIEHELGYPLEWEELPTRRDCRISVYMTNVDPEDERDWPRQHQWLTSKINDFHRVFLARVRDLDAEDWKQDGVVDVSAGPSQADG
jgi:hypothetical protein